MKANLWGIESQVPGNGGHPEPGGVGGKKKTCYREKKAKLGVGVGLDFVRAATLSLLISFT